MQIFRMELKDLNTYKYRSHAFDNRRYVDFSARFEYFFWTSAYSFAQTQRNIYCITYPYIVRVQNLLEFRDMAHGQNVNSFQQPSNSALENTLFLLTAKKLD